MPKRVAEYPLGCLPYLCLLAAVWPLLAFDPHGEKLEAILWAFPGCCVFLAFLGGWALAYCHLFEDARKQGESRLGPLAYEQARLRYRWWRLIYAWAAAIAVLLLAFSRGFFDAPQKGFRL